MKFIDLCYLSFQSFKRRRSRLVFTVLGISVGISAVLFLVSLGYGLQKILLEKITTAESLLTLDVTPPESQIITLNADVLEQIKAIDHVDKVSPQVLVAGQVSLKNLISETSVNIVDADFFSLGGILATEGRTFIKTDQKKVVVNSTLAELFNLSASQILGRKLTVVLYEIKTSNGPKTDINLGSDFEVIGLIEESGAPAQLYLHNLDLQEQEIIPQEYQFAKVKVTSDIFLEEVRTKLIEMGFLVSALSDTIEQANKIFRVIQITLGTFGIIGLVVAAIGLMNTMTISLLQRTNDIGIMRALGASPNDIKMTFLMESLIIGLLGGIFGIILGMGFAEIFNLLLNFVAVRLGGQKVDLFYYPLWFIGFILVLSGVVGFVSGIFPAKRAAKLNPLEALRYK